MSESLFANLPRFDGGDLSTDHIEPQILPASEPEEVHAESADHVVEPVAQIDPNVEVLLNRLAQEIDQANRKAVSQTAQWVSAIVERLFPELSKAFLAEEIARQIPKLLPATPNHVTLSAPSPLAEQLSEIVENSSRLAGCCTVEMSENSSPHSVDVTWETGGLSLEFDELLAACLERLQSYKSPQEES